MRRSGAPAAALPFPAGPPAAFCAVLRPPAGGGAPSPGPRWQRRPRGRRGRGCFRSAGLGCRAGRWSASGGGSCGRAGSPSELGAAAGGSRLVPPGPGPARFQVLPRARCSYLLTRSCLGAIWPNGPGPIRAARSHAVNHDPDTWSAGVNQRRYFVALAVGGGESVMISCL